MSALTTEELRALNAEVRRILEERERLLHDITKLEAPPRKTRLPEKHQSKLTP
jgi:hypothetical protein